MVVKKMMRWPPWPPVVSRKFEAKIVIQRLEGLNFVQVDREKEGDNVRRRLVVEIKWKGQKSIALRRSVRRNFTEEGGFCSDGVVEWNEEFKTVCNFSVYKEGVFLPWEVSFTVFNGLNQGQTNKVPIVGTASLNLAEFASTAEEKEFETNVPLTVPSGTVEGIPLLCLSLRLVELRTTHETSQAAQRSMVPVTLSPRSVEALSPEKNELSSVKAGFKKVKIFTVCMSAQSVEEAHHQEESSDGRFSVRGEDAEYNYPFDTDSLDDDAEGESDEGKEDSSVRQPVSYETLAYANWTGGTIINAQDEGWIYYSNRKSAVGGLHVENSTPSDFELQQSSRRRILPWRKRKLSFRSPKAKGEPLLKKDYREQGGDSIDFDRRQLNSSDESSFGWYKSEDGSTTDRSSISEFGDDNFAVGSWEHREVISRDGDMKLQAQVFFASIDQRSERAAGESACTALVAVIANWLQSYRDEMPIKSEFNSLIREGSLEWRNLCENQTYIDQFPDKHFDLETVLQAKICPLSLVPEKSFIGFFHPEGLEGENFDFLHGAMSFDSIWDEISRHGSEKPRNGGPLVYIVSWNDHFFVLKVEQDAYYIIDTLGERLYEGCNQAYVLKFDKDTTIQRLPNETKTKASDEKADEPKNKASDNKSASRKEPTTMSKKTSAEGSPVIGSNETGNSEKQENSESEEEIVCRGKESCKEYIKSFLASIPIRELQTDIKKGLISSTPLHQRLQIEFHYTQFLQPVVDEYLAQDATADAPAVAIAAMA